MRSRAFFIGYVNDGEHIDNMTRIFGGFDALKKAFDKTFSEQLLCRSRPNSGLRRT
jgi:hypothetical protein